MAGEIAQAFVRIRPNMASFEAETLTGVRETFKKAAAIAGLSFGAEKLFEFGKGAAEDAASVQKSQELIRTEFGRSGEAITKWAEGAGIKLGVASHESQGTAARLGILFHNMDIGQQQAATMTMNLEKLAGALAASRGIDPVGVFDRLPIALAGNIRGLKQLGISIDASLVKSTALALGYGHVAGGAQASQIAEERLSIAQAQYAAAVKKYGENTTQAAAAHIRLEQAQTKAHASVKQTLAALTPAQRAMVIYTIATHNLGQVQKQAAAHSDDYANVQRRLSAEWDQARETIGAQLLPILGKYGSELARWLERARESGDLQRDVNQIIGAGVGIIKGIASVVHTAWGAFNDLSDALGGAKRTAEAFFAVMAINKIRTLASSIVSDLVQGGFAQLELATKAEQAAYIEAFGTMEIATVGLSATIKAALISTGIGALVVAAGVAATLIIEHWSTVKRWVADFGKWIYDHSAVLFAVPVVGQVAFMAVQVIKHWKDIKDVVAGVGKFFSTVFVHPVRAIEDLFALMFKKMEKLALEAALAIVEPFSHLPKWLGGGPFQKMKDELQTKLDGMTSDAGTAGTNIGTQLGQNALNAVQPFLTSITQSIEAAIAGAGAAVGKAGKATSTSGVKHTRLGATDVRSLLIQAGATAAEADYLTYASTHHEDPSGDIAALNDNPKTKDYSVGLWQINYFGKMLAARTRAFGSPRALASDPAAQARAALSILRAQGPGAWPTSASMASSFFGGGGGGGGGSLPLTVGTTPTPQMTAQQIAAARRSLTDTFAGIRATASQLGGELTKRIKTDMSHVRAAISDVANADDISKVRSQLSHLRLEVSAQVAALREHLALTRTFDGLKQQSAKLGADITPAITAAMQRVRDEIGKAVTPTEVAKVRSQMTRLKTAIQTQMTAIKEQADGLRSTFDGLWGRIAQGADTAFQRATSAALKAMQVTVSVAGSSFQFGGGVTATPAEQALKDLQESHQAAQDAKTLSEAQASLAAAQARMAALTNPSASAVTQARASFEQISARILVAQQQLQLMQTSPRKYTAAQVALQQANITAMQSQQSTAQQTFSDLLAPTPETLAQAKADLTAAQAAVDEALFNQKSTALQKQSAIERTAADTQLQTAQDAYQTQRDLLQTQMDDRVGIIEKGMLDGTIKAEEGMKEITDALGDPQYGIDVKNSAIVLAGSLYAGLDQGLKPVFDLFDQLAKKMREIGLLPGGNTPAGATNTTTGSVASLRPPRGIGAVPDDVALATALKTANKDIVDELKKQTHLLDVPVVTRPGGANAAAAAAAR